ncbi:Clp protease N-terminal domain-containing protein [Deinococcus planocerae]|uniref:Clp protease N-terminal domain-containing protein n=1 Tax=Deinococcus planocerae TaxID=1737569 RepID=UPI000C7E934A|nr:Clp protease N-terminal domain-containing protein [Deinococcus planocerae]
MNRYDDQARLTFHYAREEANALRHAQVGPEHLLLGLLRAEGTGRDVLLGLGADLAGMRQQVRELSPPGEATSLNDVPNITPLARRVMEVASQEARTLGAPVTSTPHILLGIVQVGQPVTRHILASLGVASQVIVDRARAAPLAAQAEMPMEDQERRPQVEALRHLLEETLSRDGTPPAGMTEDEVAALVIEGGDPSLIALFEDVVYRWVAGDSLSENRKHAVLLHLVNHALRRRD